MLYVHIFHYIGFVGAQLFNTILAVLVRKRAGSAFGGYRHVMLFSIFCSMFFSWIEIITQPVHFMKGPLFVIFMDSTYFPFEIGEFILLLHCATFGFIIAILTAQFFYRYIALCKPKKLIYFEEKRVFLIFVPCFFVYFIWYHLVVFGMSAIPEKRIFLKQPLLEIFDVDSMRIPLVAPLYWSIDPNDPMGQKKWRVHEVANTAVIMALLVTMIHLILFFALNIYRFMKTARVHMSPKTLELNHQLFVMLTIQTIVPMVTMYIPVGLLLGLPILNISLGPFANYSSASIAIFPFVEPLIGLFCISDFRKCIFKLFSRTPTTSKVNCNQNSAATVISKQLPPRTYT